MLADVHLTDTPYVIKNVTSDRMYLWYLAENEAVYLDGWIGRIRKYEMKLVLK